MIELPLILRVITEVSHSFYPRPVSTGIDPAQPGQSGIIHAVVRVMWSTKSYRHTVSAGFAPWRVRPHTDSSSDKVLQVYLSHTEKEYNIVRTMKQKMLISPSLIH